MGGGAYSYSDSSARRVTLGTYTNSIEQNFPQQKERKAHHTMKPQGITLRESRDSEIHPTSFPIILGLDLTGSMHHIPEDLIKDGLPTMISNIIQGGVASPALLFLGIGDHETDKEPLQVGQFESGDKELDLWLGRTYLEGGGGGNSGESYGLAHYFAANFCKTDSFEKRGKKGLLITIGDEPNLKTYPSNALKYIMGSEQASTYSDVELYEAACKEWEVFHINPRASRALCNAYWSNLLGQNYIQTDDFREIPKIITKLVLDTASVPGTEMTPESDSAEGPVFL